MHLLYQHLGASYSREAKTWLGGLEKAILSLETKPDRGAIIAENKKLRHLLYKSKSYAYRIIYAVSVKRHAVTVVHIRHAARKPLSGA